MAHLDHHFFNENRQKILRALKGGLLVLPAYSQMQRGNDAAFKFEQEANFGMRQALIIQIGGLL